MHPHGYRHANMATIANETAQAAGEMWDGTLSVQGAVESIAAVSEQTAAGAEEVSASTEEQSASAEQMNAGAQELAALAAGLKDLVGRFILDTAEPDAEARPSKNVRPLRAA